MTINEIISNVIAGGLLGILGQGVRIAVGLKKFNDDNTMKVAKGEPTEKFNGDRLMISIFIGFVAGAIGMLVKGSTIATNNDYNTEGIVTIIAIGYSGADFIEGVFNTYIKKFNQDPTLKQDVTTPVLSAKNNLTANTEQPLNVPDEANFDNSLALG